MKMKALAVAVAALACGTQAFAAEIYNSDGTSLAIGGHVSVGVGEYDGDTDVKVHQVSPRLNVAGKKDIGNGVAVDAKGEWALNYLNGGGNSFTTRLGYIGATHDQFGRLVAGTQWSPYYDVAGVADLPIAFANNFLYKNHGDVGSARANKMLSYRKGFQFGDGFAFNLGLGWQGGGNSSSSTSLEEFPLNCALNADDLENAPDDPPEQLCPVYQDHTESMTSYDDRFQIALSSEFFGVGVGYAYSGGDVSSSNEVVSFETDENGFYTGRYSVSRSSDTQDATSHIFSAKYGSYGSGIYAALVYGMNDYFYDGYADTTQLEAIAAYAVNGWNFIWNYESVEDDDADTVFSHTALQAEYSVTSSFYTFAGYQLDLGNDIDKAENDEWTIGARYYF